jgi:hypothetical protein
MHILYTRCPDRARWPALRSTTSQPPNRANRKKVHVRKKLPPPWGLPGATWRLVPSHQLVGALDPPAVTSVSAPNTRSLIFAHGGVGPGERPVLGQVPPKRAVGAKGAWVRVGSWRGSDRQHRRGAGAPEGVAPAEAKSRLKNWHGSRVWARPASAVLLRCYCGALTNHRAQVECVTGRNAPPWSFRRCRVGGFGPSAI